MNVRIKPSLLGGNIIIPPSKSLSHRAIIAASLASGKSKILNVLFSKDILATIDGMEALGAKITKYNDYVEIIGCGSVKRVNNLIDANESGSTIRFLIPIAMVNSLPITFRGKNNLVKRPLDSYLSIFDKQNISYSRGDDYLPLNVAGALKPGSFDIRGDISSQFITGLMFALPLLDGNSIINLTSPLESKGYVDLTIDILKLFGIEIINNNYTSFSIKGNQSYKPHDYTVEGDYSQAAFFLVANALGSKINLLGMNKLSHQGDKKILDDLKAMGCELNFHNNTISLSSCMLLGTCIDFSQSPDLGPALAVLASKADGSTKFVNASRLRIKECDRISCMKSELEKLGVSVNEFSDGMEIFYTNKIKGCIVDSHNDHRVAMSLAILATIADDDVIIINAECVSKSFPSFWDEYIKLGGKIIYE